MAAEFTLFALLSTLPLLLVAAAGLGVIEKFVGVKLAVEVEQFIEEHIVRVLGEGTPVLGIVQELFAESHGATLTLGLAAVGYGASRAMVSLVGSLDIIYDVAAGERRGWIGSRVVGVGLALTSVVAGVAAIVTIGAGGDLAIGTYGEGILSTVAERTASLFGYAFAVLYMAWLYKTGPRRGSMLRDHLVGAGVAVAVGEVSGRLLKWWFKLFDANAVFGTVASAMALLWWTYIFACGIVLGAEINAYRSSRPGQNTVEPSNRRDR